MFIIKNLKVFSFLSFIFASNLYALVDYTEPETSRPTGVKGPTAAVPAQQVKRVAPKTSVSNATNMAHINFGLGHEALDVSTGERSGKVGLNHFYTHFQTNYDLFLSASFWTANSDDAPVTEQSSSQNGNPEVILGFNWLKFGRPHELATIDLFVGHSFRSSSDLGSSRNDMIAGIETSKRFHDFFLGLGYEFQMTGTPEDSLEADIGNIQKLTASLGWRATADIQFIIEGESVTVRPSEDSSHPISLDEELSFASITPKLGLGLRPYFQLELGARFQTQEVKDAGQLYQTRLWNMGGAYGNSIFAGLNISI